MQVSDDDFDADRMKVVGEMCMFRMLVLTAIYAQTATWEGEEEEERLGHSIAMNGGALASCLCSKGPSIQQVFNIRMIDTLSCEYKSGTRLQHASINSVILTAFRHCVLFTIYQYLEMHDLNIL